MILAPRRVMGLLRPRSLSKKVADHRDVASDRDVFPRSHLMRAIVNPDNRGLWIAGAAVLTVLFPRLIRLEAAAAMLAKYQQLSRHLTSSRH